MFLLLGMTDYLQVWNFQKTLLEKRIKGEIEDIVLITEHLPTFTLGSGGKRENLLLLESQLKDKRIDFFWVDRGGDITFHGPGQIVCYLIISLRSLSLNIGQYVDRLEEVIIATLGDFNLSGDRFAPQRGVYVDRKKIGFIGLRVRRGVTMHGFSLNINVDLSYFDHIVPCDQKGIEITSIEKLLSCIVSKEEVICSLTKHLSATFDIPHRIIPLQRTDYLQRPGQDLLY
ncbi:MAG: lipoyl(octanoyl) transferase LipB, partial [bacterium]|nr:lipoyl(octanoyl) transferase LipB [bacterium]